MIVTREPKYPTANYLNYDQVTPQYESYLNAICIEADPVIFLDVVKEEKSCVAMHSKLRALEDNGT